MLEKIHQKSVDTNESEEVNKTDGIELEQQQNNRKALFRRSEITLKKSVDENLGPEFLHEDIDKEKQEHIDFKVVLLFSVTTERP